MEIAKQGKDFNKETILQFPFSVYKSFGLTKETNPKREQLIIITASWESTKISPQFSNRIWKSNHRTEPSVRQVYIENTGGLNKHAQRMCDKKKLIIFGKRAQRFNLRRVGWSLKEARKNDA